MHLDDQSSLLPLPTSDSHLGVGPVVSVLGSPLRRDTRPRGALGRDILPLLAENCFSCHGPDPRARKANLRLDTQEGARKVIVPGKSADSEFMARITSTEPGGMMPPAKAKKKLAPEQITLLSKWIDAGAPWGRHWAYETPQRSPIPEVKEKTWPRNAIDFFVLARMEREGLRPSPEADRVTLLRRVSLDLIGLPPTPEEVDQFLADRSPDAYERVVDRLLRSPHYGEQWARPWLDSARYADSHGFQRDDLRDVWPYRDWVIKAFNADMPFDQFTVEQLAGDLLPGATPQQKVATGLHRCTPCNVEAGTDPEENRFNQVFDRVNTTAAIWLGTTMECCQCHDHKYDPFSMRDYYRLFAYFNNTPRETESTDKARANPAVRFVGPYLPLTKDAEAEGRKPSGSGQTGGLAPFRFKPEKESFTTDAQTGKQRKPLHFPRCLVMQEAAQPRPTHLLKRGNFLDPGERVEPGTPAVLPALPAHSPPNRLALARWLVSGDNPLPARVNVNRWWAELFGRGLVATPEDFGSKGDLPTHPELLDWLAVEFMGPRTRVPLEGEPHAWSVKHLHQLIVTSAVYRQSSRLTAELLARDDQNKLLARGPRLRLDAEAVRDNALAVSGLLSHKQFGPPVRPPQPDGLWRKVGGEQYVYTVSTGEDRYRRGIYVIVRRSAPYPSFANFDAPARLACTVKRPRSNTPLQALTLLNDPVHVEAARALAERVLRKVPSGDEARLIRAFRLCVARPPREKELAILTRLLKAQRTARTGKPRAEELAWVDVASALLNLEETITRE